MFSTMVVNAASCCDLLVVAIAEWYVLLSNVSAKVSLKGRRRSHGVAG